MGARTSTARWPFAYRSWLTVITAVVCLTSKFVKHVCQHVSNWLAFLLWCLLSVIYSGNPNLVMALAANKADLLSKRKIEDEVRCLERDRLRRNTFPSLTRG